MPLSKLQHCAADSSAGRIKFCSDSPSKCSAASRPWSLTSKTSDLTKGNRCRERARTAELRLVSAEPFCIAKPSVQQGAPGDNIPREPELRPLNSFSADHRCTESSQVLSVTHSISHRRAAACMPGTAARLSGLTAAHSHSFPRQPIVLDATQPPHRRDPGAFTNLQGRQPARLHGALPSYPGKHGHTWGNTPLQ